MPVTVSCIVCEKQQSVIPARAKTFKFCGFDCRSVWRSEHMSGANHPGYTGGERTKTCQHCGVDFSLKKGSTVTTFRKQKFCSNACGNKGGIRHFGAANTKWTGRPTRRQSRPSKHAAWARAVISRDLAACQRCGATDTELHAHHVKSHKDYPELRFDLDNGLTVCAPCHWQIHSKTIANGVNSGETAAGDAAGNPEPSFGRKPIEGATTRGRAYRRWNGSCEWCGAFISRRWSDTVGRAHLFCSKPCAGKFKAAHRTYRPMKSVHGSNASTSAPHPPSRVMI